MRGGSWCGVWAAQGELSGLGWVWGEFEWTCTGFGVIGVDLGWGREGTGEWVGTGPGLGRGGVEMALGRGWPREGEGLSSGVHAGRGGGKRAGSSGGYTRTHTRPLLDSTSMRRMAGERQPGRGLPSDALRPRNESGCQTGISGDWELMCSASSERVRFSVRLIPPGSVTLTRMVCCSRMRRVSSHRCSARSTVLRRVAWRASRDGPSLLASE